MFILEIQNYYGNSDDHYIKSERAMKATAEEAKLDAPLDELTSTLRPSSLTTALIVVDSSSASSSSSLSSLSSWMSFEVDVASSSYGSSISVVSATSSSKLFELSAATMAKSVM